MSRPSEEVHGDLAEFARYNRLDAYELTDAELARMLEVWRWHAWTRDRDVPAADRAVIACVRDLQRRLAYTYDIETEYNTALLLRQEIEPLMHLRALGEALASLRYCLNPARWIAVLRALLHIRRYRRIDPVIDAEGRWVGYPRRRLERFRGRAPDLMRRKYWRPLGGESYAERKRSDVWW
jgi:hypothetical protein